MCRAGGRRCPGQYDPAKAAARNAKRRAQRAAAKNVTSVNGVGDKTQGRSTTDITSPRVVSSTSSGVEDTMNFQPLTELSLKGTTGEKLEPVVHALESVARKLDEIGDKQAANALRYGGREIALAEEVRAETLTPYYRRRMITAHLEGNAALRDSYGALMDLSTQSQYIKEGGPIGEEYSQETAEFYRSGGPLRSRDRHASALSESYLEARERGEQERASLRKFQAGDTAYTAKEMLQGKDSAGEPIPQGKLVAAAPELQREMMRAQGDLMAAVSPDGSVPDSSLIFEKDYGNKVEGAEEFTVLGKGAESFVYLHGPTGLVYKVPHRGNITAMHQGISYSEMNRVNQEAYAAIDDGALREHGVENIKTLFSTAHGENGEIPIQIQPYCPPSEWEPMDFSAAVRKRLRALGVTDLHQGNVRVNAETREVQLLDCLPVDRGI